MKWKQTKSGVVFELDLQTFEIVQVQTLSDVLKNSIKRFIGFAHTWLQNSVLMIKWYSRSVQIGMASGVGVVLGLCFVTLAQPATLWALQPPLQLSKGDSPSVHLTQLKVGPTVTKIADARPAWWQVYTSDTSWSLQAEMAHETVVLMLSSTASSELSESELQPGLSISAVASNNGVYRAKVVRTRSVRSTELSRVLHDPGESDLVVVVPQGITRTHVVVLFAVFV